MITVHDNLFFLHGKDMSYIMKKDEAGYLYHLYYGKRLGEREYRIPVNYLRGFSAADINDKTVRDTPNNDVGWLPKDEQGKSLDEAPQEYPSYGRFDLRTPAVEIEYGDGNRITDLRYDSHEIVSGKPDLPGLPAAYAKDSEAQTLHITLKDVVAKITVILSYTVYEQHPNICRNVLIQNNGKETILLRRALSANIDFAGGEHDVISFPGSWARERHTSRQRIHHGIQEFSCARGASGHQMNPFIIVCDTASNEDYGDCYGFSLVYSGNHSTIIEKDQYDITRVQMGIHPGVFTWELKPDDWFQTPECILAFSSQGLTSLTQSYHDFFRENFLHGYWSKRDRPILLNSWEASYFDYNEETLLTLAEKSKALGIEMLVMDDGWFGKRDNDHSSLGDWYANKKKLPGGLSGLVAKVNALGLDFGLWMEPEMISPDSELYRAHPDWAVQVPGRTPAITRWQYVLDLSRTEVQDYIIDAVSEVLRVPGISYIKWDMNRHITDMPDSGYNHRYILGLYRILDKLTRRFPRVLFESCSGGGGRMDPGIMYYMPQTWISDNSDAIERLYIQEGTSYAYPLQCMTAHVSAVPNHQTGRITPLSIRGHVAQFGMFGYELNPAAMSESEKAEIMQQIETARRLRKLMRSGDFYRIASPYAGNDCVWQVVSKDKRETVLLFARILSVPNPNVTTVKLKGLLPGENYHESDSHRIYGGDELMYMGIQIEAGAQDYFSILKHLVIN
ncbi:alpha-galactosidase [Eubacterium sp. am_0171]|uniref:alpha-galactosidase n=1 Tax=unclassified Eubacterium (in: firmicutes) TaxID=2624479 RepID=UPI0010213123|nr:MULTISPECIES: alpha-galactosidase [unclassified Eubacterium (in: firmicutes)]MCI6432825.1 alpha-galactosidase [Lachnospiraceae bacterium]MSC84477.1 alpha-galactosidase [Eubacterium sp. BIOML-A1]MSD08345.1 alpha-galactosidase [Eubacterium sp. BIOML-A2]RYT12524.1 alpha-galactosidase [Eubacterium sp. am_0171]